MRHTKNQPKAVRRKFAIGDLHLCHENIIKFTDDQGKIIRNFATLDDMHRTIIQNWQKVVSPVDKVYVVGDVAFSKKRNKDKVNNLLSQLWGHKTLILGNHDEIEKDDVLLEHFDEVLLWKIFKEENFVMSHVPLRQDSFRYVEYNVHGHIHQNLMAESYYINVSCEQINYTPMSFEEIRETIRKRK